MKTKYKVKNPFRILTLIQPLKALALLNEKPASLAQPVQEPAAMFSFFFFFFYTWVDEAELPNYLHPHIVSNFQFSWPIFANQSSLQMFGFFLVPKIFSLLFFFFPRTWDGWRWNCSLTWFQRQQKIFGKILQLRRARNEKLLFYIVMLRNPDCRDVLHHDCFWLFWKRELKSFTISQQAILHGGVQVTEALIWWQMQFRRKVWSNGWQKRITLFHW